MIKIKDGYARLVGTSYSGSQSHLLLSNGGVKAVSDFAVASHSHSYLPLTGGTLTGNVTISTDSYLQWVRNTDYAKISFKNDSDSDSDSYMYFLTGDNGNEYFKFAGNANGTVSDWLNIKSVGISANSFIKIGSDNNSVLLGGGGTKALSDLSSSSHNHDTKYTKQVTWSYPWTSNKWNRVLNIVGLNCILLTVHIAQNGQFTTLTWMITVGFQKINIIQLGCSNYDSSSVKIRGVHKNNTNDTFYIDWYNTNTHSTSLYFTATVLGKGTITPITTNTIISDSPTGETVLITAIGDRNKNINLNADLLDGKHIQELFTNLSNSGNNISLTIGNTTKTLQVNYSNSSTISYSAHCLQSRGNLAPQTGRTQNLGDVYSYNTNYSVTGGPATYTSIIGFGRGTYGTVEIAGCWTSGRGLWVRSLRDVEDDWFDWDRILTASTYTSVTDTRYYTKNQIDNLNYNLGSLDGRFVNVTGDIMTGQLTINGSAASQPLKVRNIVGSDGAGGTEYLYLQYGANNPIKLGNEAKYDITADGSQYTGNSASSNRILSHIVSDTLANKTTPGYLYHATGGNSVADKPSGVNTFGVFTMQAADGYHGQILMSADASPGLYWRTAATFSGGWIKVLDSSNYTAFIDPADYVTSLGINGNYLTWTKDETTNNITIPYASNAGKLLTSIKLWGQSFDGTKDISGNITGAANISASGNIFTAGNHIGFTNSGEVDKFFDFGYKDPLSSTAPGASWRIGSLNSGSGDTNYFVIQTGGSSTSSTVWDTVMKIEMDKTRNIIFDGIVVANEFDGVAYSAASLTHTLTMNAGAFTAKTFNGSSNVTVNIPTKLSHLTNDSGFWAGTRYWANIAVSTTSSTITTPIFGQITSGYMILGQNGDELNMIGDRDMYIGYRETDNVLIHAGNIGGTEGMLIATFNLDGLYIDTGKTSSPGFVHTSINNNNYVLTAGGSYKAISALSVGSANKLTSAAIISIGNQSNLFDGSEDIVYDLYSVLISSNNEFNFTDGNQDNYWFNYKTISGSTSSTAVLNYYFGNGQRGYNTTKVYAGNFMGKLGDSTVGSNMYGIYLNEGSPTKCDYYLNASVSKATDTGRLAYYQGTNLITPYLLTRGSTSQPIYLSGGKPTACTASIGSSYQPIYMKSGVLTQCSAQFIKLIDICIVDPNVSTGDESFKTYIKNHSEYFDVNSGIFGGQFGNSYTLFAHTNKSIFMVVWLYYTDNFQYMEAPPVVIACTRDCSPSSGKDIGFMVRWSSAVVLDFKVEIALFEY